MKFMVSCRHPLTLLKEVNEIKVDYKDIDRIRDFVTEDWTSSADIVVYLPKSEIINWDILNTYKDLLHIIIAVEDTQDIITAKEKDFSVFWSYPASSYWELRGLLDLGVDQVLIDAPLYFDLPKVKRICGDVELRLQVNKCMNGYMKRRDGVCGTYVRPEDIEEYSKYVEHFEFDTDDLGHEKTLWNIYTKQKTWPGNLNLLLTYLNKNVDNRGFELIPNDDNDPKYFAHRRLRCAQRCQQDNRCNFCNIMFDLINSIDKNNEYLKKKLSE